MTTDQNDFFMYTTSDFGDSFSEGDNEEPVGVNKRSTIKEPPQKSAKSSIKQTKAHAVFNVHERFLYHPEIDFSNLAHCLNSWIEVRVEACYLSPNNPNVANSKVFGTDHYTSTSDFVAIFMHSTLYNSEELRKKAFVGISLTFFVTKQKRNYLPSKRNGVVSRKLNVSSTVSFQNLKLVHFELIRNWKLEEVHKLAEKVNVSDKKRTKVIPERKDGRNQPRLNSLIFNMNNELAVEYSLVNLCEKSSDPKDFLSSLLRKHYMVIETMAQAKFVITAAQKETLKYFPNEFLFRVTQIKNPIEFDNEHFLRHRLPKKSVEIIKGIPWEDITWTEGSIRFKGFNFEITQPISFKFYRIPDS